MPVHVDDIRCLLEFDVHPGCDKITKCDRKYLGGGKTRKRTARSSRRRKRTHRRKT